MTKPKGKCQTGESSNVAHFEWKSRLQTASDLVAFFAFALAAVLSLTAVQPAQAQTESILHNFANNGTDGYTPYAGLAIDTKGNLYGTTYAGGANKLGTVFKVDSAGNETVVYSFTGATDATQPQSRVARDKKGNLYGTTYTGGAFNNGTVFKITPAGTETVLYSFTGGADGSGPYYQGVVLDKAGNIYGTTVNGGNSNLGTVFKLTPTGTETVLHSFSGGSDGYNPVADLAIDAKGNLYGTTFRGGTHSAGTVFKVTPAGSETVLYSFAGGVDGYQPYIGGLVAKGKNLYGTTVLGGANGCGTVFRVTTKGAEKILYSFANNGTDGCNPFAGLVRDASGNLYGSTLNGGASGGYGTVFKLTPTGTETVLHSFAAGSDGASPYGSLVLDATGNLYGTTSQGGSGGIGTVFKVVP